MLTKNENQEFVKGSDSVSSKVRLQLLITSFYILITMRLIHF